MTKCFGLLRSEPAGDSIRAGLSIDEGVLRVTGAGGINWDISLDRVQFIRWAEGELRLELSGELVAFLPEDPDAVIAHLVPALAAPQRAQAAATVPSTPAPAAPDRPAELEVDLTEREQPPGKPAAPPLPDPGPDEAAGVVPKPERTGAFGRLLGAGVLLAVVALVAWGVTQLGQSTEDRARDALVAGGFETISVSMQDGIATLSGSAASDQEAEAARSAVGSVDGVDSVIAALQVEAAAEPPTTSAPDTEAIAANATQTLAVSGLPTASVEMDGAQAIVTGLVSSELERRAASETLLGVEGIGSVDNRLEVITVEDTVIEAGAREALNGGGFDLLSVDVVAGVVTVAGVAPQDELGDGFFQLSEQVDNLVLAVQGVTGIQNRLQLKGDEATLRRELKELTDTSPVIFELGKSELTAASRDTLNVAAGIIQAQPGLRVLVAGHADTTGSIALNEELSRARAAAVRSYLIELGVAANRVVIVAYGELFPSAPGGDQAADRRVEFEVAA